MQGDSNSALPLEKKKIKVEVGGEVNHIAALDKFWVSNRVFPLFLAPPKNLGDSSIGVQSSYLELLRQIYNDLSWLLNLPLHKFLSQTIYSKAAITCLTSFLQDAPPAYCQYALPDEIEKMLSNLAYLVFLIFYRLSISHESPNNFVSPMFLGNLLYDNYIFTVPIFFDLCSLYGPSNKAELCTMLRNVISMQPKYLKDTSMTEPHILEVLNKAVAMFSSDSRSSENLSDLVTHVYDALVTSRIFLEIFPNGCEVFGTNSFISSVATFYSIVMPDLTKNFKHKVLCDNLRIESVRYVRTILENVINCAMDSRSMEDIEKYLNLVSEIMSEDVFICDYHAIHPLNVEFEIIMQLNPDIDMLKIDYLLEALASHVEIKLNKVEKHNVVQSHIKNYPSSSSTVQAKYKRQVSGIELESLISQVHDLLPHLGEGFIEACLKHYDYSTENVVSAVLDSSLPPHLEETNWQANRESSSFDINTFHSEEIGQAIAFKNKKPREHRNLNDMLSDKREIKEMKDKFANLGYVEDDYDDEYDDTYDDQDVNVREPDEVDKRRAFVVPRVLRKEEPQEDEEEDEEIDPEPAINGAIKRDMFIQNPEEIRAKYEQRRANAHAQRDVVGRAKGQGQDKEVLKNREKKNVHKAASGNHNRRDRASRKRNQGMIPS